MDTSYDFSELVCGIIADDMFDFGEAIGNLVSN